MSSGLPLYAALTDLRAYGIASTQVDDPTATDKLDTASRSIDDFCGNADYGLSGYFARVVTTLITVGDLRQPLVVLPRPFANIQSVLVNGQPLPPTMQSSVAASPAPTTTTFNAAPGMGAKVMTSRPIQVGGVQSRILSVTGDTLLLSLPLPAPPAAGASVIQWPFIVEDWGLRIYYPTVVDADGFPLRGSSPFGFTRRGFGGAGQWGMQVDVTADFGFAAVPQPVKEACILVAAQRCQQIGQTLFDPSIQRVSVEGYTVDFQRRVGPKGGEAGGDTDMVVSTGVIEADRLLRRYQITPVAA